MKAVRYSDDKLQMPPDGKLAASEGQIMLALRNPLDTTPTTTSGVRTAGLFGQAAPVVKDRPVRASVPAKPVQAVVVEAPKASPYTVEAIRGAKRTEEIVR